MTQFGTGQRTWLGFNLFLATYTQTDGKGTMSRDRAFALVSFVFMWIPSISVHKRGECGNQIPASSARVTGGSLRCILGVCCAGRDKYLRNLEQCNTLQNQGRAKGSILMRDAALGGILPSSLRQVTITFPQKYVYGYVVYN